MLFLTCRLSGQLLTAGMRKKHLIRDKEEREFCKEDENLSLLAQKVDWYQSIPWEALKPFLQCLQEREQLERSLEQAVSEAPSTSSGTENSGAGLKSAAGPRSRKGEQSIPGALNANSSEPCKVQILGQGKCMHAS